MIALDHLDEKNPGMLLNSLVILQKSLDNFPELVEECLGSLLERTLPLVDIKKVEIGSSIQKFLCKIYDKLDCTKCCKELLKLSINASQVLKVRIEAISQVTSILKAG